MHRTNIHTIAQQVENTCGPFCTCRRLDIHGISHLRRVAITAGRIAASIGEDVESAVVAGFLHDCARSDDGGGTRHAHDSAVLAKKLLSRFYPHLDTVRLCDAIARHADGETTEDLLAACVWDADRLDLTRLGIEVDPDLLSTTVARRIIMIRRSIYPACDARIVKYDGNSAPSYNVLKISTKPIAQRSEDKNP